MRHEGTRFVADPVDHAPPARTRGPVLCSMEGGAAPHPEETTVAHPHDDPDGSRAALALMVAVLDGDCDQRLHELLCVADDPHLALRAAHHLAHLFVGSIDAEDHAEMRADLAADLLQRAGEE